MAAGIVDTRFGARMISPRWSKARRQSPPSTAPTNRDSFPTRILDAIFDALAAVAFVVVGAIVLTVGAVFMAAFDAYRAVWWSIYHRDYALAAISAAFAIMWSAVGLSLVGLAIWWLIGSAGV